MEWMARPSPLSSPNQSDDDKCVSSVCKKQQNAVQGLLDMAATQVCFVPLERDDKDEYGWGGIGIVEI